MAKEAPEKIYIQPNAHDGWFESNPNSEIFVEYTRTDTFVEKVCDWLSDNLQTIVDVDHPSKHHVESVPVLGSITQTEFLSKFKREIKYLLD